jgi:hypothetical protein
MDPLISTAEESFKGLTFDAQLVYTTNAKGFSGDI